MCYILLRLSVTVVQQYKFIKTSHADIASWLSQRTTVKMKVLIVTIEGNIGTGKTTLLQKVEQSLSGKHKVKVKVEHEPVKELQCFFYGYDLIIHWNTFIRILLPIALSFTTMY